MKVVQYFLEADDDTYIYGDKMFECQYVEETNTYIQPFVRQENEKVIKFYRDKQFFAVYENAVLTEIIFTMTCWSDDIVSYNLKDGVAYEYNENYHGRPYKRNVVCNKDFSKFISEHGL